MTALESDKYREEHRILCSDPIVQGMARELERDRVPRFMLADEEGEARWEFMSRALDTYRRRGGRNAHSIGGPARALLTLVSQSTLP